MVLITVRDNLSIPGTEPRSEASVSRPAKIAGIRFISISRGSAVGALRAPGKEMKDAYVS